jgi:hypothetical protein
MNRFCKGNQLPIKMKSLSVLQGLWRHKDTGNDQVRSHFLKQKAAPGIYSPHDSGYEQMYSTEIYAAIATSQCKTGLCHKTIRVVWGDSLDLKLKSHFAWTT